ncbi:uncharacterized protein EI97DRAFT_478485, partial [Westerdykella ornata]
HLAITILLFHTPSYSSNPPPCPKLPPPHRRKPSPSSTGGQAFRVALHRHEHHRPSQIMTAIRRACNAHHPQLRLVNSSNDHVRLWWDLLSDNATYYLKRASEVIDQNEQPKRDRAPESRLAAIMQAWGLETPYDILPASIAPRVPLPDGSKTDEEDADLVDPNLWSNRFLRALWTLAAVMDRERTLGYIAQVMESRQGSYKNELYLVPEVLVSDLEKARQLYLASLREIAEEAGDQATYAGGLREGIEEVEEEMHIEDGTTLGNMQL